MSRFSNPVPQFFDLNGDPYPGGKIYFFEPGTTTPKDTFSDAGLSIANPNPVVLDGNGRMPSTFLDGTYKSVLKDANGETVWTRDPIGETTAGAFQSWLNDETYNAPDIVLGSDDEYYRSLTNNNQGNDPTSSPANWEQLQLGRVWNSNITYSTGDSVYAGDGYLYFSIQEPNLNQNPASQEDYWSRTATESYVDNYVANRGIVLSGSATFTNADNNIALTGIGLIGLEIGDVISVSGSVSNDKQFTVEVITDANNIIVNQAHAGGATSKALVDESSAVTITLLAKWYNAPTGLGQGTVSVSGSRVAGATYTNLTSREIKISVSALPTLVSGIVVIGGVSHGNIGNSTAGNVNRLFFSFAVPPGETYSISNFTISQWSEQR